MTNCEDPGKSDIQLRTIDTFFGMNDVDPFKYAIVNYKNDTRHKQEVTILIARLLLESSFNTKKLYDLLRFNCEVFATYCRTGQFRYDINMLFSAFNLLLCRNNSSSHIILGQNKLRKWLV